LFTDSKYYLFQGLATYCLLAWIGCEEILSICRCTYCSRAKKIFMLLKLN